MKVAATLLFAGLSFAISASGTSITLGTQEWANGNAISTGTFNSGSTGEPAPFNGFIGSDTIANDNFSASWTFSYTPAASVSSATIVIGIYDLDSTAAGSQIQSFKLDGIDLTSNLDAVSETANAASGTISILTLTLPSSVYTALASGTATFSLILQNGTGVLGPTPSNGAGLDFSTLNFTAGSVNVTPEPSSLLLFGSAFLGLAAALGLRKTRSVTGN